MTYYDNPAAWNPTNGVNPVTGYPITARFNIPEIFAQAMSYEEKLHVLAHWVAHMKEVLEGLIEDVNTGLAAVEEAINDLNERIEEWQTIINNLISNAEEILQDIQDFKDDVNALMNRNITINATGDVMGTVNIPPLKNVETNPITLSMPLSINPSSIPSSGATSVQLTGDVIGTGTVDGTGKITVPTTFTGDIVSNIEIDYGTGIINDGSGLGNADAYFLAQLFFASGNVQISIAPGEMTRDTVQPDGGYTTDTTSADEQLFTLNGVQFTTNSTPIVTPATVWRQTFSMPWGDGSVATFDIGIIISNSGGNGSVIARYYGGYVDGVGSAIPAASNTAQFRGSLGFSIMSPTNKS